MEETSRGQLELACSALTDVFGPVFSLITKIQFPESSGVPFSFCFLKHTHTLMHAPLPSSTQYFGNITLAFFQFLEAAKYFPG